MLVNGISCYLTTADVAVHIMICIDEQVKNMLFREFPHKQRLLYVYTETNKSTDYILAAKDWARD